MEWVTFDNSIFLSFFLRGVSWPHVLFSVLSSSGVALRGLETPRRFLQSVEKGWGHKGGGGVCWGRKESLWDRGLIHFRWWRSSSGCIGLAQVDCSQWNTDRTWLERLLGLAAISGSLSRRRPLSWFSLFLGRSCHYIVLGGCGFSGTTSLTMPWWRSWTVCSSSKKRLRKARHAFVFLTGQYSLMLNAPGVGPNWAELKGQ